MLLSDNIFYDVVAICVTLLASLVLFYKWSFSYWKRVGLEYLPPKIPLGNTTDLLLSRLNISEQFAQFYNEFKKRGLRHGGVYMFNRPLYVPVDINIVKDILQKDFSHFVDRGFYVNEEIDPLSGHLFSLEGAKWKNLRSKLTATFTSGKMKMMFETMAACAKQLETAVEDFTKTNDPVDIKEILARFTTDIISSTAFGLESNCLKDPDTPMRYFGKRVFENTAWENMKNLMQFMFPSKVLQAVNFKVNKPDVENFMLNMVKKTVNKREQNNIHRKDFLHLLLQLKNRGKLCDDDNVIENGKSDEVALTLNELTAQVFVFFIAGYETSSTAMTFALYELSINQNIQDKLRKEIVTVLEKHNNEISYEAVTEMTYMDQVLNESMRKYPPVGFLTRKCNKAYQVPNTNYRMEEGTMVFISSLGIHHDPEYYPEPSKFDPERFSEVNKNSRPAITWIPFGEGPRICIGLRFGMLQAKMGLATLIRNYRVTLSSKTQTPLVMDKKNLVTSSESGVWLNISKL